ncbi:hypothetical protein ElyMa_002416100 [Elysia marginata]|uniref:Integrase catalytic domain-containing protein n=1 Tax=Elysia marginata TaxID=1093978 RepID=A0AAV4GG63_9GAST|nr:hypothetical protein ElyMa_002416100 [Elysia marginata]
MYEVYNHTVCIPANWLISEGIFTKWTYHNYVRFHKIHRIRRAAYNTPALVSLSSLPTSFREAVEARLGAFERTSNNILRRNCHPDAAAGSFFARYILPDGKYLPYEKQVVYHNNAMLLNACRATYNIFVAQRKKCGGSTAPAWQQVLECLLHIKDIDHSLGSSRRLRDKMRQYEKEGYQCLVPGYWKNRNGAKVKSNEQEATLRQLLRKHNNFDNMQIAHLYNVIAKKMGWDTVVAQTVANYREKWEMTTSYFTKGSSDFNNAKKMLVKRCVPSTPLYYWTLDGWQVELLYQKRTINSRVQDIATYHNRPYIVVVLDPCVNYPIGYAIGISETPELIREALRDAMRHTSELFGSMYRVEQLQSDHFGRGVMKPFYEGMSNLYTPAKAGNAKAKRIEPWFKEFNRNYCQYERNWSGFGLTSKKTKQPNDDYLNRIKKTFPRYDELVKTISGFIEQERKKLKRKYIAAYGDLSDSEKTPMTHQEYLYALGEKTGYTNRLSHDGLTVTLYRERITFESFDPKFRDYRHKDWTICFDPSDTDSVLATADDGALRFLLTRKHEVAMAIKDRTDKDAEVLCTINKFNNSLLERVKVQQGEDARIVDSLRRKNNDINETLEKLMLTDGLGQHKTRKDTEAKKRVLKKAEKLTKKADLNTQKTVFKNQDEYYKNKVNIDDYLDM